MAPESLLVSNWKHGKCWRLFASCLAFLGCTSGDLSSYLSHGRCDDAGRCATGYECDTSDWQCVRAGTAGASGASGTAGSASVSSGAAGEGGGSEGGNSAASGKSGGVNVGASGASPPGTAGVTGNAGNAGAVCPQGGCSCENGLTLCGDQCVDLASEAMRCGSCSNTCVAAGVELACGDRTPGVCGCAGDDARCGDQTASASCDDATGFCRCDDTLCVRGEVCRTETDGMERCSCDGISTCASGETCCLGNGCVDLQEEEAHCGACGSACPSMFRCVEGSCRCKNDNACDEGGDGKCSDSGLCLCDTTVCSSGLRCVSPGVCG